MHEEHIYAHVGRMPEERLAKRVYQSTVHGMVGRGIPPVLGG